MKNLFLSSSFLLFSVFAFGQSVTIAPDYLKVPVVTAIPSSPPTNSEGRMVFVNISGNKQLYVWNGTTWAAVAGVGGGSLTPPVILTGTGNVLTSNSSGGSGRGLVGTGDTGTGVEGNVGNGTGVAGYSNGGTGIYGQSSSGSGGIFQTSSNTNSAIFANTSGTGGTAIFFNDATTSTNPTLRLGNQGNGRTLEVINSGKNFSGFFNSVNAGATAPALYAGTYSSTQPAAQFVGANALQVDGLSNFNGRITREAFTGSNNLVPIAYGLVNADGTISSGTGNFTITHPAAGVYKITVSGISAYADIVCTANYESAPNFSSITTDVSAGISIGVFQQHMDVGLCGSFPTPPYPCLTNYPHDGKFSFVAFKP